MCVIFFMRSIFFLRTRRAILLFLGILFFINTTVFSQSVIRGKVTGKDGIPLHGATIKIDATNNVTSSDSGGHFVFTAKPGDLIEFSFVGYIDYKTILRNETELNISLIQTTVNLDDVVVIGYGTARKKDLTGAVSSVSAK